MSEDEIKSICSVLAAIYHLGVSGAVKGKVVVYWAKIFNSMEVIQMSEDGIKSICSVLAAIYHLGVAGAVKGKAGVILGQDL